ncbi:MAG: ABC transporter permease [Planctomycetota bacterium]|nr:ABC transporter permease [Planctomycetota bacterium]
MTTTAARTPGAPAFLALTRRELLRFTRQPSRIVATIATPALLWIFLAGGFAQSFAPPGESAAEYAAYLLPGMAVAVVLFSAIFAAMSLIEDRNSGFLQSVLIAPAPTWSTVAAKSAGGAILATLQAIVVLAASPLVGLRPTIPNVFLALLALIITAVAIISLGLAAAWRVNSSEGFHGVMNLLLMPMWLLSGAFFPADGAAPWLRVIMRINPLHHCTESLRASLANTPFDASLSWLVAFAFAAAMLLLAAATIGRRA